MMRLGIISDCIHYQTPDGRVGTENHILLKQLQALCSYFSQTIIACPFGVFDNSKVLSCYTMANIQFHPLPVVGGNTLTAKFSIVTTIPLWLKAYKAIDEQSDVVYMRFPNNLNIPGFFYYWFKQKKAFATYTGTWKNHEGEPATYRFQRWLLTKFFKGPVWVYNENVLLQSNLHAGFSPSYSISEWNDEATQVQERKLEIINHGLPILRLISVGALATHKNHSAIISACALLRHHGFLFTLTIVGDGPLRSKLTELIDKLQLADAIQLAGKKTAEELRVLYRQHHFIVQAPLMEGFGKVPVEGFFHGVIPILNNVSLAAKMVGNHERGFLFDANNLQSLVDVFTFIKQNTHVLPEMIDAGRTFAQSQTLDAWAREYFETTKQYVEAS